MYSDVVGVTGLLCKELVFIRGVVGRRRSVVRGSGVRVVFESFFGL